MTVNKTPDICFYTQGTNYHFPYFRNTKLDSAVDDSSDTMLRMCYKYFWSRVGSTILTLQVKRSRDLTPIALLH